MSKTAIFWAKSALDISKTAAQIKKFYKYDPPKVGVSKAKKGFWGQKIFSGAPQNEKN